jgi:hypothetical protein
MLEPVLQEPKYVDTAPVSVRKNDASPFPLANTVYCSADAALAPARKIMRFRLHKTGKSSGSASGNDFSTGTGMYFKK